LEVVGNRKSDKLPSMHPRAARVGLVVAGILFFSGFFLLCACPGWYALTAAFASVAVWAGTGRTRAWGIACLVASLIFTGLQTVAAIHEKRHFEEILRKHPDWLKHRTINHEPTKTSPD
jgi:hypothetical protein